MLLCSLRKRRRTLAMVSTINIPGWLPDPGWVGVWKKCRGWVPFGRRSARQPGPFSTPILNHRRHPDPHPRQGALSKVRREANCLGVGDALLKLGHAPSTVRNMAAHQVQVCVGVGHGSNTKGDDEQAERKRHVQRSG